MIIFKTAAISDAEQISQLVNSAYRGDSSKKGWTTEADLLDGQRTDRHSIEKIILEPKNNIQLVIEKETNEILGTVHLKEDDDQITLYFGMLTVKPTLQARQS